MENRIRIRTVVLLAACSLLVGCDGNAVQDSTPAGLILPSGTATAAPPPATIAPTGTESPPTPSRTALDRRAYTVKAEKADVWNLPENENTYVDLQTQLILGEKVLILEQSGDWSRIVAVEQPSRKDPLGYPGWVRSDTLAAGWLSARQYAVVMKPRSALLDQPDGSLVLNVTLDTHLPVIDAQESWIRVHLPDDRTGWLPAGDVRIAEDLASPVPLDGIFDLAEQLIGVPYLWGGTTAAALDCSGYTYRLYHAYGITLSRDADDLASGGVPVARSDLQKGDMIFTSGSSGGAVSHLGMYWGNSMVLDASGEHGVMLRPMTDFFTGMYWISAKRFLPQR